MPGSIAKNHAPGARGVGDGSWAVRVYDKPFVNWIWFGCILMALGGALALSDRRYRVGPARAGAAARTAAATAG